MYVLSIYLRCFRTLYYLFWRAICFLGEKQWELLRSGFEGLSAGESTGTRMSQSNGRSGTEPQIFAI